MNKSSDESLRLLAGEAAACWFDDGQKNAPCLGQGLDKGDVSAYFCDVSAYIALRTARRFRAAVLYIGSASQVDAADGKMRRKRHE